MNAASKELSEISGLGNSQVEEQVQLVYTLLEDAYRRLQLNKHCCDKSEFKGYI